jgi:homoserine dehydrogenase
MPFAKRFSCQMIVQASNSPLSQSNARSIRVMKFGSSTLRRCEDILGVARFLREEVATRLKVVAVVSALHGETDRLLAEAHQLSEAPCPSLLPRHVLLGEEHAASALALSLVALGVRATHLSVANLQLIAEGEAFEAEPIGIEGPLGDCLLDHDVVVIPGFGGWCVARCQPVLLGRGGSDLTAVHAAKALGLNEVTLVKDVDGIYSEDPKASPKAHHYDRIGWSEAFSIAGRLVQRRALEAAERFSIAIEVRSLTSERRSIIAGCPADVVTGEAA